VGDETGIAIWERVHDLRLVLADQIEGLTPAQWGTPSWCSGWRVRDVLAHLVHLAESSQLSMARDLLLNGVRPNPALNRIACRMGGEPVPELAQRLRRSANGHYHVVGGPRTVALGEVLVHGEDALRPLGLSGNCRPADVRPVLELYRRVGPLVFHARRFGRIQLVATDVDWSTGEGPAVHGRAIDILLLLANRRGAIDALSGPGLPALS
jgi:uncharacterized protein (TIGR03083 family)